MRICRAVICVLAMAAGLLLVAPQAANAGHAFQGEILTEIRSGLCVEVGGWSKSPGGAVIQWPCTGGANQKWTFRTDSRGYYEIRNVHSGLCMDVAGFGSNGARIIQWPCNGATNQRWHIQTFYEFRTFRAQHNFQVLDVPYNSGQWGVQLWIWPSSGLPPAVYNAAQLFSIRT